MRWMIGFAILALAGCGVDGEPERPERPSTGITVSGEARIGVSGTL